MQCVIFLRVVPVFSFFFLLPFVFSPAPALAWPDVVDSQDSSSSDPSEPGGNGFRLVEIPTHKDIQLQALASVEQPLESDSIEMQTECVQTTRPPFPGSQWMLQITTRITPYVPTNLAASLFANGVVYPFTRYGVVRQSGQPTQGNMFVSVITKLVQDPRGSFSGFGAYSGGIVGSAITLELYDRYKKEKGTLEASNSRTITTGAVSSMVGNSVGNVFFVKRNREILHDWNIKKGIIPANSGKYTVSCYLKDIKADPTLPLRGSAMNALGALNGGLFFFTYEKIREALRNSSSAQEYLSPAFQSGLASGSAKATVTLGTYWLETFRTRVQNYREEPASGEPTVLESPNNPNKLVKKPRIYPTIASQMWSEAMVNHSQYKGRFPLANQAKELVGVVYRGHAVYQMNHFSKFFLMMWAKSKIEKLKENGNSH